MVPENSRPQSVPAFRSRSIPWEIRMRLVCLLSSLVLSVGSFAAILVGRSVAVEVPPPETPVEEVVDSLVDAALAAVGVTAAPAADDTAFLRRVTLDLAGRIPTAAEVESYLASTEPDKKARLVDRLMASPDFVYHTPNDMSCQATTSQRR
jgi:hypothetical protein